MEFVLLTNHHRLGFFLVARAWFSVNRSCHTTRSSCRYHLIVMYVTRPPKGYVVRMIFRRNTIFIQLSSFNSRRIHEPHRVLCVGCQVLSAPCRWHCTAAANPSTILVTSRLFRPKQSTYIHSLLLDLFQGVQAVDYWCKSRYWPHRGHL